MAAPESDASRKRKAHKKSRGGCHNCKLRRVKCDETKPRCQNCLSYSVACNYSTKSFELELSVEGAFRIDMAPTKPPVPQCKTTLAILNAKPIYKPADSAPKAYHLTIDDLEALQRFQTRTVMTLGSGDSANFCKLELVGLAFQHPFLMHVVLAMTLVHDRQSISPGLKPTTKETFHWYQTTSQLSKALSGPIKESEKDALWMTATLLGGMAFSDVRASTPYESWPLKPSSPSDLDWLKLSDGKKVVWKLVSPTRMGSKMRAMALSQHEHLLRPFATFEQLQALPPGFVELYDLRPDSNAENNPYYNAAAILAQLMGPEVPCNRKNIIKYCCFLTNITPTYKQLLISKDPRALLLMGWWWSKACGYEQWWFQRRALTEGQAICIYLETYYGHEDWVQKSLKIPKILCGLEHKGFEAKLPLHNSGLSSARNDYEQDDRCLDFSRQVAVGTLAIFT